uniref:Uncharacterized protein n=1 Tax=Meloidogyne enterolobii TaxID=390850 RepID=A0A6V7X6Q0_MELEN|nr:unnamed protein product [Meloidogyne enterolobii]
MVKLKVKNELNYCPKIAFTSDIWSDTSNSFISLTAHGIGKNFQRKSFILSISEFPGSHTGEKILEKIRELLKVWNFAEETISYFVHDEGSNFRKAFSDPLLNFENFLDTNCSAHMENIVVRGALDKNESVKNLLAKCRHIVGHYKHSPLASNILKKIQMDLNIPARTLLQDMPCRWNASYNMIKRIAEQQEALAQYAIQNKKFDFTFDANESILLHELTKLLEPLEELTKLFCCQTSSISVKFPYAKLVIQKLSLLQFENSDVNKIRDQIISGLGTKFFVYKEDRFVEINKLLYNNFRDHQLAMFFDPRFKDKMAEFPEFLRYIIEKIKLIISYFSRRVFLHFDGMPETTIDEDQILPISPISKKPKGLLSTHYLPID